MLRLEPLVFEGGSFRETWVSAAAVSLPRGIRPAGTCIYYLLEPGTFSEMHTVESDEIFHFYLGDPVEMLQLLPDGSSATYVLGSDLAAGQHVQLVVPAGPSPAGHEFDSLWATWRSTHADIVDEHYYMNPKWFLSNTTRYDNYDRSGPKVFAGEYAAQTGGQAQPDNRNTWGGAIAEAAFMTGLERNADVVRMASYAPLLANVNAWQWTPDLIWFDNLRSYDTPNYQVQKLFASNVGTRVVPVTPAQADNLYAVASIDERTHELILTAVNYADAPRSTTLHFNGVTLAGPAKVITLASSDLKAENGFDHPATIAPTNSTLDTNGASLKLEVAPYSVTVYRFPLK